MQAGFRHAAFVLATGAALLWPAYWNGYPLVFGDTGAYLYDGIHHHVSWPRPFFYGLAMVPLHLGRSAWPVVVAQALTAAGLLRMALVLFAPGAGELFAYAVAVALAAGTSLPWFASQMMPDLFGALAVLAMAAAVLRPERLRSWQRALLVVSSAAFIAFHQSYVPTMALVAGVLLVLRRLVAGRVGSADVARAGLAPVLALAAVVGMNAVFQGRVAFSPYGNIFVLARLVVEGPAQRTLARECPRPGWTLCDFVGRFPDSVEAFQFGAGGIVTRAGGYQAVSAQAGAIVADTLRAEPSVVLASAAERAVRQLGRFATGDWLLRAHPDVDEEWAAAFPPAEVARYEAARQQRGLELVPDWLQALHQALGFAGMVGLAAGIVRTWRRQPVLAALLLTLAAALVINGAVSGALSGVYDRYQSRFIWLGVLGTLLWVGWAAARARAGQEPARERALVEGSVSRRSASISSACANGLASMGKPASRWSPG